MSAFLFFFPFNFLIVPKQGLSLRASPVVVSASVAGGTIWKSKILMTNPDRSRS